MTSTSPMAKRLETNAACFTFFYEHKAHFCSKFKNKLRTIPASAKNKVKFLI